MIRSHDLMQMSSDVSKKVSAQEFYRPFAISIFAVSLTIVRYQVVDMYSTSRYDQGLI